MAYTDDQIQQLRDYIAYEGQLWAKEYITQRKAHLAKRKINASGELIASLEYDVQAQAAKEAVNILLGFEEYGRILDMRRVEGAKGGSDYINSIVDWIQRKGFADEMISEYMSRRKLRTVPDRVLVYIAWGIVAKRSGGYKRKAWYNKSKSAAISELYNTVASGLPDIIGEQIKEQLQNGSKTG